MANRRVKVEVVTDFLFLGSKITVDGDCVHEVIRQLLLSRKALTNLDSVLESRDISLWIKVCIVKAMDFPVGTYSCENWTVKKAEQQRTDAFKLWCCKRLLKVPWTERSNQLILREINPKYLLEGLMKLQYFGHLMWTVDSLEKSLMLGKGEEGIRGWDVWMASSMQWTWTWANFGRWWETGRPGVLYFKGSWRVGHNWKTH